MSLDLHVDAARWHAHTERVLTDSPALVPVTKGNGYGFGNQALFAEATRLGVDLVAVGTTSDLASGSADYPGDVLVLVPWHPFDPPAPTGTSDGASFARRLVHTVGSAETLAALSAVGGDRPTRVVLELATSMRRHGIPPSDYEAVATTLTAAAGRVQVLGLGLHLPLPGHAADASAEVGLLLGAAKRHGLPADTVLLSHVTVDQVGALAAEHPSSTVRLRTGTALWLGDHDAYRATATVLDVRPIRRGETYGYRSRRAWTDGHLLTVSGGTAHGIATEPPAHVGTWRNRAVALSTGTLGAGGLALSPFSVAGRRRWFAEPPHMQVSMLMLPAKVRPPAVGAELPVNVSMALTRFDRTVWN